MVLSEVQPITNVRTVTTFTPLANPSDETEDAQLVLPDSDSYSKESLYAASEMIQELAVSWLNDDVGGEARRYLQEERGLSVDIIAEEGLGFVPDGWRNILTEMSRRGVEPELLVQAGHARRSVGQAKKKFKERYGHWPNSSEELSEFFAEYLLNDPSAYYDYPLFKLEDGRGVAGSYITIPFRVRDDEGKVRVVSWIRRSTRKDIGKGSRYRTPLNTAIFSNADTLLGLAGNEPTETSRPTIILCEGPFDYLALKDALRSLPDSQRRHYLPIALGGVNAKTVGHYGANHEDSLQIARDRAGALAVFEGCRVIEMLDQDKAGIEGAVNIGTLLLPLGCDVRVARVADGWRDTGIEVPEDPDPSLLYLKLGATGMIRALTYGSKRSLVDFVCELLSERLANRPSADIKTRRKFLLLDEVVPVIAALPSGARRAAATRLESVIGVEANTILLAASPEEEIGEQKRHATREDRFLRR